MKKAYYTRHADSSIVETVFSKALKSYWSILETSRREQSDRGLSTLVSSQSMAYVIEETMALVKSMPLSKGTEVVATSLLAHAAFLRAAAEYYKAETFEILLAEPMSQTIDIQAQRQELWGNQQFFFALMHVALGDLCSEQEQGGHSLVLYNGSPRAREVRLTADFFVALMASEWGRIQDAPSTGATSDVLAQLASLLCSTSGPLFSRLTHSEN